MNNKTSVSGVQAHASEEETAAIMLSSLSRTPRRVLNPGLQCRTRPFRRLVCVTDVARIGYLQRIGLAGRDELEGVAAHVDVRNGLLDLGHVAGDALATRAANLVMRMCLDGRRMRTVLRVRAVAVQAYLLGRLPQYCVVFGAVHVMATKARDATRVHQALHEVVALHSIFVRSAIGKVCERGLTELVLFQLPKISQILADVKAHRPVVVLTRDGILQRLAL